MSSRSLKIAVLGLAVAAAGCNRESSDKAQPAVTATTAPIATPSAATLGGMLDRSRKGSPLPQFTLKDQAGKTVALATQTGKPLLVNLWATWCAPCIAELPQLDGIAAEGRLRVLTVAQDMQGTEKVAEFLSRRGGTHLEPWLDPKNDLAFHYEAATLPTTILYDAQGHEIWRYVGGMDWSSPEARKLLAEAG